MKKQNIDSETIIIIIIIVMIFANKKDVCKETNSMGI
jgi:hypothetical protein